MTTLEIVLSIIVYILFALLLYKPFKRISENKWSDYPEWQCVFTPFIWVLLLLLAINEGFKILYKKSE